MTLLQVGPDGEEPEIPHPVFSGIEPDRSEERAIRDIAIGEQVSVRFGG